METRNRILIVDDEVAIQRSLKRSFFDFPYSVFLASSGREALQIIDKEEIDLVISDYKMAEMDGIQFLDIVKKSYPSIIRILISGFINKEKLMESLFLFNVVSLLPKPWDEQILHRRVEECLNLKNEIGDIKLWDSINSHNLVSFHNSGFLEGTDLHDYITCEPAIYSGLLHLYNSDYYNGGQQLDLDIIEEHFTRKSIRKLIDDSPEDLEFSSLYGFFQEHSRNVDILFFLLKDKIASPSCIGKSYHPSLINLFRYIVWICDRKLFNKLINDHFFIYEDTNGALVFNQSTSRVFLYIQLFLRLWNFADPLLQFANHVFECYKKGGFPQLEDCGKLLFLCDYYLEKYRGIVTNDLSQKIINELDMNNK